MDLFTYLMAKNNQNTHRDLFSYLLGKNAGGSGTYTTFSGTSLNISNTIKAIIKNFMLNSTELTQDGTPSPSNPVDVNVITGENNVKVENKNLLNFTFTNPIEKNGITFTKNNNGSLTLNGTATTTFSQVFNITHKILNGTYTIKHNVLGGTTSASSYLSIQKSPSGNISDRVYGGTGSSTFNIAEDTTIITASLYITSGTTFTDYNVGSQLEIGSTATEYVEHQEQNYPITLSSKNLSKISDGTLTYEGLSISIEKGVITLNGTTTSSITTKFSNNLLASVGSTIPQDWLNEKIVSSTSNKTFSIKVISGTAPTSGWAVRAYVDGTQNINANSLQNDRNFTKKYSTDGIMNYIGMYVNNGRTFENFKFTIQLEEGTTATEYEPYYNIEYCKIGNYADQIFKNTTNSPYYDNTLIENEWYLYKRIINYNGSWRLGGTQLFDDSLIFYGAITNVVDNKVYSTHFPYYRGIYRQNYEGIDTFPNSNEIGIRVNKNIATTANELQEWLSNNNVKILYATTTPTYIHISQADYPILRSQLENLYNNAKSYDGQTNITQTNDNLPFNLSVDVKVTSVGNLLNTSLLSSNIQEETNIDDIQEEPNLDDVNEIEEQNDEPIENEEPIEEEVS